MYIEDQILEILDKLGKPIKTLNWYYYMSLKGKKKKILVTRAILKGTGSNSYYSLHYFTAKSDTEKTIRINKEGGVYQSNLTFVLDEMNNKEFFAYILAKKNTTENLQREAKELPKAIEFHQRLNQLHASSSLDESASPVYEKPDHIRVYKKIKGDSIGSIWFQTKIGASIYFCESLMVEVCFKSSFDNEMDFQAMFSPLETINIQDSPRLKYDEN